MLDLASSDVRGPVLVTVAYFVMYYAMLFGLQSRTKYRLKAKYKARGEKFDRYHGRDQEMLAADRAVGNTHEQQGPFIAGLWLYAIFVDPRRATTLGTIYVVFRAAYPFLLRATYPFLQSDGRLSKRNPKLVIVATLPNYLIIFYFLGATAVEVY